MTTLETQIKKYEQECNKTLIGQGYLFLINDSNKELRQHLLDYCGRFNLKIFMNSYLTKLNTIKVPYFYCIIPDKSVICSSKLPFELMESVHLYRQVSNQIKSQLADSCIDFYDVLKGLPECYFQADSHMNHIGGYNCYKYLIKSLLVGEPFDLNHYDLVSYTYDTADLIQERNWGGVHCAKFNKLDYVCKETRYNHRDRDHDNIINISEEIIPQFAYNGLNKTQMYRSKNPQCSYRVLILRDSSTNTMIRFLSEHFKETLYYVDHNIFNIELVNYYKPDMILEIRTERMLIPIR